MNDLAEKIDNLNVRERMLIGLVIAVLILALWDAFLFSDQQTTFKKIGGGIIVLEANLPRQEKTRADLLIKVSQDPNVREQIRLARLEKEIERLDMELKKGTIEFISPKQMVGFLKEMINKQSNLELITLLTLDAEAMIKLGMEDTQTKADEELGSDEENKDDPVFVNVYRHGLEMYLKGDYFAVLEYVKKLENIGWRFEWNVVALEMVEYPVSRVKIQISTLSMNEGWIGV